MDGEAVAGSIETPDVVVTTDADGLYYLFVERSLDGVSVEGDRALLDELLADAASAAPPVAA